MRDEGNAERLSIKQLEELLTQKNAYIQYCLVLYTNALELLEKEQYIDLEEKLEECDRIQKNIEDTEEKILSALGDIQNNNVIIDIMLGNTDVADVSAKYRRTTELVNRSRSQLRNCQVLIEKLTYRLKNDEIELQAKIEGVKNQKKIKEGYGISNTPKSELDFHC